MRSSRITIDILLIAVSLSGACQTAPRSPSPPLDAEGDITKATAGYPGLILPSLKSLHDSLTGDFGQFSAFVGTVKDSASGRPIWSARVSALAHLNGPQYTTMTDLQGNFVIGSLEPDRYLVTVNKVGYRIRPFLRYARPGVVDTVRALLVPSDEIR